MRHKSWLLAAAAFLILAVTSCLKTEESNYSYSKRLYTDADSLRAVEIQNIIQENPYFTEVSTYFGTYSDTFTKAQSDFLNELGTINDTLVRARLQGSEYATVALISDTPQEIIAYKTWTAGDGQ